MARTIQRPRLVSEITTEHFQLGGGEWETDYGIPANESGSADSGLQV
jgi:hypothetical protein